MKRIVIVLAALLSLAGCTEKRHEEKQVSNSTFEKTTHCIGHSLVDFPADFYLMDGASGSFLPPDVPETGDQIDVTLLATHSSEQAFAKTVVERKSALLKEAWGNTNRVSADRQISPIAHLFTINVINESHRSELLVLLGNNIVQLTTDSYENTFAAAERRLTDFLANMKTGAGASRGDGGYCMGDVLINGKYKRENSQAHFRSDKVAGVVFGIEYDTFVSDESKSLLQRVEGPDSLLKKFDVKRHVLRKGELQIASMKAQEWLSWVVLGDGDHKQKQFAFALETMRPVPSPAQPRILLELDSGKPDKNGEKVASTLLDADATALWDVVSRSIRSRLP